MEAADRYAPARDRIRETVKWLGTVFAALAAVILAGSPFSELGSLPLDGLRFWAAVGGLLLATAGLMYAVGIMILLLGSATVFPSQLRASFNPAQTADPAERRDLEDLRKHLFAMRRDLLPTGIDSFDDLEQAIGDEWNGLSTATAEAERENARLAWKSYSDTARMYTDYALYYQLKERVRKALPLVMTSGLLALLGLAVFAWAANPGKGEASAPLTLVVPVRDSTQVDTLPRFPPVLFQLGRADINSEGLKSIAIARDFLRAHPETGILLLAHTDTLASETYNRDLAKRRGEAVRRLFTDQGGLASSRVFVAELPKTHLPKLTFDEVGNPSNRAVELLPIKLPATKAPELSPPAK